MLYASKSDEEVISASEEALKNKLKDPYSAIFEDIKVFRSADAVYICGHVNAKNAFGGYIGSQYFMAAPIGMALLESNEAGRLLIPEFCLK